MVDSSGSIELTASVLSPQECQLENELAWIREILNLLKFNGSLFYYLFYVIFQWI